MLQRMLVPALLLLLAAASLPSAGEKGKDKTKEKEMDNPFRTAKVGEFTSYKMTTKIGDLAVEGTMKIIVSEKNEKSVKLKTEIMVMGTSFPAQETTIDLTKPFDVTGAISQGKKGKFEKSGEGTAKIKVAGKEYDAKWIEGKVVAEAKGLKIDSEVKVWFSKDIPLNGMLRMETKASIANVVLEFVESGATK